MATYFAWLAEFNGPRIVKLKAKTMQDALKELELEDVEPEEDTRFEKVFTVMDHTLFEMPEGMEGLKDGIATWYEETVLAEMEEGSSITLD